MKILLLTLIFSSLQAFAGLVSPFPPSVPGTTIPNTHAVDPEGLILRGMEPREKLAEFLELQVQQVLIFKKESRKEVRQQIEGLLALGYRPEAIHHIPFLWKDYPSMTEACEQTMRALQIMHQAVLNDQRLFIHCTVGEDRTGHLAALYRLMTEGLAPEEAFEQEMCAHGYARANPNKPGFVVGKLNQGLSVLFFEMAEAISQEPLAPEELFRKADQLCSRKWNLKRPIQFCSPR